MISQFDEKNDIIVKIGVSLDLRARINGYHIVWSEGGGFYIHGLIKIHDQKTKLETYRLNLQIGKTIGYNLRKYRIVSDILAKELYRFPDINIAKEEFKKAAEPYEERVKFMTTQTTKTIEKKHDDIERLDYKDIEKVNKEVDEQIKRLVGGIEDVYTKQQERKDRGKREVKLPEKLQYYTMLERAKSLIRKNKTN